MEMLTSPVQMRIPILLIGLILVPGLFEGKNNFVLHSQEKLSVAQVCEELPT